MMKLKLLIWVFWVFIFTNESHSRPISYPGGWTIMQMNNLNTHSFHLHYSPSITYSLGYKGEYWREKEWQFHGIQLNYLVKRFNTSKSQSNFYLKNGVGFAFSDFGNHEAKAESNIFSGISLDWENRQYFTSYENKFNYNNSIDKFFLQKTRIGYAPYVGEYGDLHTWIMLQVQHMPNNKNIFVYTPMLRMFKGDYLAEVGLSNTRDFMFNVIRRF